jgi:transposase
MSKFPSSPVRRGAGPGVEVRVRAVRRRSWSTEDKLRIVRETLEPSVAAKAVADRHGISTGLLFTWRKQMLATAMSGFAQVDVVPEAPRLEPPPPAAAPAAPEAPGTIEIGLPSGATVRVSGRIDPGLLRAVLAELGGR